MKYTLFCILISFYSILFEKNIFNQEKTTFINSQDKYFPEKYTRIHGFPFLISSHRLSTVIHRQWQESVKCLNGMEEEPSEIAVVQISRTEWNFIMTWLTRFHGNAFYGPEINGKPIVYIGDLTSEIRARAARHVIRTRGNSRLNKS